MEDGPPPLEECEWDDHVAPMTPEPAPAIAPVSASLLSRPPSRPSRRPSLAALNASGTATNNLAQSGPPSLADIADMFADLATAAAPATPLPQSPLPKTPTTPLASGATAGVKKDLRKLDAANERRLRATKADLAHNPEDVDEVAAKRAAAHARLTTTDQIIASLASGTATVDTAALQQLTDWASHDQLIRDRIARPDSLLRIEHLLRGDILVNPTQTYCAAELIRQACKAGSHVRTQLLASNVIEPLVAVMLRVEGPAACSAAAALCNLACQSLEAKMAIVRANALPGLLALLRLPSSVSYASTGKLAAAACLSNLAAGNPENRAAIVMAGSIDLLTEALEEISVPSLQAHAASALWSLGYSPSNKVAIARSGAIPILIKNLDVPQARESASGCLASLMFANVANKLTFVRAGGIPKLIALLNRKISRGIAENVLSALRNLSVCEDCIKPLRKNGVIRALVEFVSESEYEENASFTSEMARHFAEGALGNLAKRDKDAQFEINACLQEFDVELDDEDYENEEELQH